MAGMMKTWFIAICALGSLCLAAGDAASLLCPAVKGEKKGEQKKIAALAKSLQAGAIDAQDKAGQTPLMVAAALDNRLAVAYLVARGADTARTDKAGKTALDYAVSAPVRELLSVCKESNATVLHEDKQKQLREMGLEEPAARIDRVKTLLQNNKIKELADVLKLGVKPDAEDTPSLHFPLSVSPEALALLVRRGYNINTPYENGVCLPSLISTAKLALALGIKPKESAAFAVALLTNDVPKAKKLLADDPKLATRSCSGMGWSPLCLVQSAEMVQVLKDAGADATKGAPSKEGEVKGALLGGIIAQQTAGAHEAEVVKALVEAGAGIEEMRHILCLLCSVGSADAATVRSLIQAGAKPDEVDAEGNTALHYAAARGKVEAVKALLEHKANPNIADAAGDTPLLFLIKNNVRLNPGGIGLPETIKALIKGGANPKLKTREGQNAPQLAKSLGREDLAKIIKGASAK